MAIAPIPPIVVGGPLQAGNLTAAGPTAAGAAGGGGLADGFAAALDDLSAAHRVADDLALQAATGDLQAVQDLTIAATEAQLLTQLTVTIRDRAVQAFNDIMHMQV
jgi:flagellar hook-basal body complex protein FliE